MNDNKLTLKEEIEIEACIFEDSCHNRSVQHHFLEGAECMRKLLIDKACEWFLSQIDYDNSGRECRVFFRDSVERFRKAMED